MLDVFGTDEVQRKLRRITREIERDITRDATMKGALIFQRKVVEAIHGQPASGKSRGDGSRASAPGEFPMTDTGKLAQNIRSEAEGQDALVKSSVEYAATLEFKPQSRGGRPYMRRGMAEFAQHVYRAFGREVRRKLRRLRIR